MGATFSSLGLNELTDDQKWELVGDLWNELASSGLAGRLLTESQRQELLRRQADAAANPDDWVSWEEARAATLKRLGRRDA